MLKFYLDFLPRDGDFTESINEYRAILDKLTWSIPARLRKICTIILFLKGYFCVGIVFLKLNIILLFRFSKIEQLQIQNILTKT